ncbi:unnamed protein product, partial [Polarella glacialis]
LRGHEGRSIDLGEESVASVVTQPSQPAYAPAAGDLLDSMLGAELLRAHLKQSIDDQLKFEGPAGKSQDGPLSARAGDRLPPLSPKSGSSKLSGAAKRPKSSHMILGRRGVEDEDAEGAEDGKQSTGKPVSPHDFVRLAPGMYSFRGERLVELWVENGEPMARDHGPKANL